MFLLSLSHSCLKGKVSNNKMKWTPTFSHGKWTEGPIQITDKKRRLEGSTVILAMPETSSTRRMVVQRSELIESFAAFSLKKVFFSTGHARNNLQCHQCNRASTSASPPTQITFYRFDQFIHSKRRSDKFWKVARDVTGVESCSAGHGGVLQSSGGPNSLTNRLWYLLVGLIRDVAQFYLFELWRNRVLRRLATFRGAVT